MINLRDRLIVEYSSLGEVAKILSKNQNDIIVLFFTLAVLFEFFGEWNFFKVFKRLVCCFLILLIFEPLLKGSIDLSFSVSNVLIDNCKNTEFCSHYLKLSKVTRETTLWSETVNLIKNFSDFWLHSLVSLIFKLGFIFTIQLYSLIYALTFVTYPLVCALAILPVPGERAFVGVFQSLLWLFLSPIVLSIVIVLLASVTDVGIGPKGEVGLEGLLHLMVLSIFSLGSLFLSWIICKGDGVAAFGSSMAQMGSSVLTMAGVGGISRISRGLGGAGGELGTMGASFGKGKLKDYVGNRVSDVAGKKGITLSANDLANSKTGMVNSSIIPKESPEYKSLSGKEKFFHGVDSFVNAKENNLAKQSMIRDLKNVSSGNPNDSKFSASEYKTNARKQIVSKNGFNRNSESLRNSRQSQSRSNNSGRSSQISNRDNPINQKSFTNTNKNQSLRNKPSNPSVRQ